MQRHLTAQNVSKLPAVSRRTDYFDSSSASPPGFCLRVTSAGHRSYSMLYRSARTRRLLRVKLGNVGEISLATARHKARDVRARVQLGVETGEQGSSRPTVSAVLTSFIEVHRKTKKARTTRGYEQILARVPRAIGDIPAAQLKPVDLRFVLDRLSSGPVMQNNILRFFKASMRWAANEEMIPPSPVERMSFPNRQPSRDRVLSAAEIVAVWRAAERNVSEHARHGEAVAALFKLLLLLGQRIGETLAMRWEDLDLTASPPRWIIPASTRKGRLGTERNHVLPLPAMAVELLRNLHAVTGRRDRVFHKVSYNAREFWTHPVRNQSMQVGAKHWKIHDLRRTCATNLGELGVPEEIVSLVLGHARKDVTGRVYNLSQRLPELARALEQWAAHLEKVLAEAEDTREVSGQRRRGSVAARQPNRREPSLPIARLASD